MFSAVWIRNVSIVSSTELTLSIELNSQSDTSPYKTMAIHYMFTICSSLIPNMFTICSLFVFCSVDKKQVLSHQQN